MIFFRKHISICNLINRFGCAAVILLTYAAYCKFKSLSSGIAFTDKIQGDQNNTAIKAVIAYLMCGGLGNQLFEYSAAFSLAKKYNAELYICLPASREPKHEEKEFILTDRSYSLHYFKIPQDKILWAPNGAAECSYPSENNPTIQIGATIGEIKDPDLIYNVIPNKTVIKTNHCFESEIFFKDYKDDLMPLLEMEYKPTELEARDILEQIDKSESVAVHIRRGDYATWDRNTMFLPITYYVDSLQRMSEILSNKSQSTANNAEALNITYFVFSDDIQAIKQEFRESINLNNVYNVVFVSGKTFSRMHDFSFMKSCKHFIIANSTFSWWAAYLSKFPSKVVIAPMPRFKPPFHSERVYEQVFNGYYSYPDNWITINPKF